VHRRTGVLARVRGLPVGIENPRTIQQRRHTYVGRKRKSEKFIFGKKKKRIVLGVIVKLDEASFAKITHRQEMQRVVSGTQRQSSSNTSNYMYYTPCEMFKLKHLNTSQTPTTNQPPKQVDLYNLKNKTYKHSF